jgi:hypothetical protein
MLDFRGSRGATIVLAALVLAGCSVQRHGLQVPEHAPSSRATTTRATPSPGNATAVPSAVVVVDPSAAAGDFTGDELRQALLGAADSGPGWSVSTSKTNMNGIPATGCPALDRLNTWPATKAVIGFTTTDNSAALGEALISEPEQSAKAMLSTARSIIGDCRTITIQDNSGNSHRLQVSEPSFPRMADDTYALRLSVEGVFYDETVLVRRGGLVLTAAAITATSEPGLLEPFVRQAFAKADHALR